MGGSSPYIPREGLAGADGSTIGEHPGCMQIGCVWKTILYLPATVLPDRTMPASQGAQSLIAARPALSYLAELSSIGCKVIIGCVDCWVDCWVSEWLTGPLEAPRIILLHDFPAYHQKIGVIIGG